MNQGSCLCGALRYEVDGPFNMMMNCHCSMCRKHHGAAFATFVGAPIGGFRWISGADQMKFYASSEQGKRSFCGVCGSVGPMLAPEMGLAILPAGNLHGDLGIKPTAHMFVGSKAPWYSITDELPQHAEYPPEFGGTGMQRPQVQPKEGVTQGSCLCGEVAFEIESPPLRMMYCYCSRCRLARSSAHATNMFYKADKFRWLRGEAQVTQYKVPDAQYFATAFCSHCGGEMPRVSTMNGLVVVPGGCVDAEPGVRPLAQIFVDSKADWVDITNAAIPQFPEMPPREMLRSS